MVDVVIIGAGPGGYQAAIDLAKNGQSVTIVDYGNLGGTCLNVGCIPTKALLDNVSLYEHFVNMSAKEGIFNLTNPSPKISQEELRKFQRKIIDQLRFGIEKAFKELKINFINGRAEFKSEKEIKVYLNKGEITEIKANNFIIATGSKPRQVPGFQFDGKKIFSSDDIWDVPFVPNRLLIVGSGPIGIEFGRVFKALGSEVTISEIREKICPILDGEISEALARSLKKRNIKLLPNFAAKFTGKINEEIEIEFLSTEQSEKKKEKYDGVLVAVGRKANIENLNLESVNLELEGEFIKTNGYLQTTAENIWAVGDVTKYPQLAHTASFQARVVAKNILGEKIKFDGDSIPSSIFGYPEVAFVGKTEEQLKEEGIKYKTGKSFFLASGKAKASGLTEGVVKILMDMNSKKILGAHIIGPEASNLIQEIVLAMKCNLRVHEVVEAIHGHPTYSETVFEALENSLTGSHVKV